MTNQFPELENLKQIAVALDELKILYYITGGFAITTYGRPRFTADIDIVIKMRKPDVNEFVKKMLAIFPNGYIDNDLIKNALVRKGEFNIIDPESGFKIDFFITNESDFEQSAFSRVVNKDYDYEIKFISPEDLIISKLLWFREGQSTRQLEDISSVIDIQENLDQKYIDKWVKDLDLQGEWEKLKELKTY